jgi:hypothetical protein
MCESLATTKEHAPPRCIFPKAKDTGGRDFRKNLIKVQSCKKHNTEKSKDDTYFLYCLAMNILSNSEAQNQFATKIMRDITRNKNLIERILKNHESVKIENTETGDIENTIALKIENTRIREQLDSISRAIHFHHYKEKWLDEIHVFSTFIFSDDIELNSAVDKMDSMTNELFLNIDFYGENPEIFKYQVCDSKNLGVGEKMMRLHFYEGNRVTVVFGNINHNLTNNSPQA